LLFTANWLVQTFSSPVIWLIGAPLWLIALPGALVFVIGGIPTVLMAFFFNSAVATVMGLIGGLALSTYLVLDWLEGLFGGGGGGGGGGESSPDPARARPPSVPQRTDEESAPSIEERLAAYKRGAEDRENWVSDSLSGIGAIRRAFYDYSGQLEKDYDRGVSGKKFDDKD
jgi:hypothetical protein